MASLSVEEENYVRMSLLLTGISPRAVRTIFDSEFHPASLCVTLKRAYDELFDLKKKHRIHQSQWNLLFPRFPDVPDSKTFDVALMILLLRNLSPLTPPFNGFDNLPFAEETQPGADLARIKHYKNYIFHLDDSKIDTTFFNTAWTDIAGAIDRLGGQQMKQECDLLKTRPLNQTNQKLMADIKQSKDEMKGLKQSIRSLKRSHTDMRKSRELLQEQHKKMKKSLQEDHRTVTEEMEIMMTSHQDTVPWNIRAKIHDTLKDWKDNDDTMYINTRAAQYVLKCIKENSCVTITASSGVGKTATLRHVSLQMAKEGYDILIVTEPSDILRFYNPNVKTLFVVDDLCGNVSLDQSDIRCWELIMENIKENLAKKQTKFLAACHLQVYQDEKFDSLSVFKSCVCNLLSENLCLSKTEKKSIAELYLKAEASEISDFYDIYDCFPLLCKMYHHNPEFNITDFFQNPFEIYESEIDKFLKKGQFAKYCALALCVMFNNKLREELLTEKVDKETRTIIENTCEACRLDRRTSGLILQNELDTLTHTFIKKEKNIYKILNKKIFDFLAKFYGQRIIYCLIRNADSGLIKERFLLDRKDYMDQFITIIPENYHQMYIQRMIDDWSKGKVQDVFSNINMKIPHFRKKFLLYLNTLDISYQRQLANICDDNDDNNDLYHVHYNTAIIQCCDIGDTALVQWCCIQGVNVNRCTYYGESPILTACKHGHIEIVSTLADKGADYNKCDNNGESPILTACKHGHIEIVRMLVDKGADYNKCDNNGQSPVMKACEHGHIEIVKILVNKGADYNKCDNNGQSSVMMACEHGHNEIVKMLVDKGADFNKCDNKGQSPIMEACGHGHTEIVTMLVEKRGADYNKCDNNGQSPLMKACEHGHIEIVKMLVDKGADFNKCDNNDQSPIMKACEHGHIKIVRMLVKILADFNKCDNNGQSPLMAACQNGHIALVRMLVQKGADCTKCDNNGQSPVMKACERDHTEIVKMLLEKGADYNKCDNNGQSPVMKACEHGHTEIVRMLLEKGADYNLCDNNGQSPVMKACEYGHTEIVRMLVDIGADYNKCDNNGQSSVMKACEHGHIEIVKILVEKGADYNLCDNNSQSPLMNACEYGHTDIVRMLLEKGADYNKCDNNGQSPIMKVCEHGHTEIVKVLLDRGADYNKCDRDGQSPVRIARNHDHTEIEHILIDRGADNNTDGNDAQSPVKMASIGGITETVDILLASEADNNKNDSDRQSPVQIARNHGNTEKVKIMVDREGDFNTCDKLGQSPSMMTDENDHTGIEARSSASIDVLCDDIHLVCFMDNRLGMKCVDYKKCLNKHVKENPTLHDLFYQKDYNSKLSKMKPEYQIILSLIKCQNKMFLIEKEVLHSAVMNKMAMLCRWLLSNFSYDYNCLTSVLSESLEIGDNKVIKALSWKITREFYKMYEQSLNENIMDIYPAYQCICHNLTQGQKCLIVSKKLIVIERSEENTIDIPDTFCTFKVSTLKYSEINDSSNMQQSEMEEILQKMSHLSEPSSCSIFLPALDGYVASSLFKKHRKLSLICPSTMKSSGYGKKHTISSRKCVQLFCHRKGIIPLGENHFQRKIKGIPTDILQGRGHFASTKLRVGDTIGTTIQQGTLGGFYDYLGHKCILTCAHVLIGPNELIAPLDDSSRNRRVDVLLNKQQGHQICGSLIRRIFSHGDPGSTSVDAALVYIESQNVEIDTNDMIRQINNAPLTCGCLGLLSPFVNDNCCGNSFLYSTNSNISIVASGAISQIETTYTHLKNPANIPANINGANNHPLIINHPAHMAIALNSPTGSQDFTMYNQIVMNIPLKAGDSGTCIYITKSTSQETGCVGMANSFLHGYSIVTPLEEIIKAINR